MGHDSSTLQNPAFYQKAVAPFLAKTDFLPRSSSLVFFVLPLTAVVLSFWGVVAGGFDWPVQFILALVIGTSYGMLGFFAHELLHGGIIKNRATQDLLGLVAFLPWCISPTFWKFWHNRLHHGNTQKLIADPDAFPTLRIFQHSRFMKFMFPFTPGSGHKRSYSYFLFWFSFHVLVAQNFFRFRNKTYDGLNHRRVSFEFTLELALLSGLLIWAGPQNILWTFLIPLMVQNYYAMSYIATNHNLSSLTGTVNDPLMNTLSVSNHPLLEALHLNFGYHVEHHLFPAMSHRSTKKVSKILRIQFPDKYQILPKMEAMRRLYQTPRIYLNTKTLIHPETRITFPTLGSVSPVVMAEIVKTSVAPESLAASPT